MIAFLFRCLECHLPLFDDVIAIGFLAKVPRYFTRVYRCYREGFGVFIDIVMKPPFDSTWALPEFNRISVIRVEELLQFTKNCRSVNLERMGFATEDFLCHMDRVHYNDYFGDIFNGTCLIDTISDSEQLCLHKSCEKPFHQVLERKSFFFFLSQQFIT